MWRSREVVAKAVHGVEGRFYFCQYRAKPLQQALNCFRGPPRRAVEQPDAELCLEPVHASLSPGALLPPLARAFAKALGASHCG